MPIDRLQSYGVFCEGITHCGSCHASIVKPTECSVCSRHGLICRALRSDSTLLPRATQRNHIKEASVVMLDVLTSYISTPFSSLLPCCPSSQPHIQVSYWLTREVSSIQPSIVKPLQNRDPPLGGLAIHHESQSNPENNLNH